MADKFDFGFFTLALEGNLQSYLAKVQQALATGTSAAIKRAGANLKNELRRQTRAAGLGDKVANAWQNKNFPEKGSSMDAASLVFSKAPGIHHGFDEGSVITAQKRTWLAIPTENVGRLGNRRLKPKEVRGLQFMKTRKPSVALLVLKEGKGLLVMFILVKQVRLQKRLEVKAAAEKWQARIPGYMATEIEQAAKRLGVEDDE